MVNWRELAQLLRDRDDNALSELNGKSEIRIEDRIQLADDRALDALSAVYKILLWIAEQEDKKEQWEEHQ